MELFIGSFFPFPYFPHKIRYLRREIDNYANTLKSRTIGEEQIYITSYTWRGSVPITKFKLQANLSGCSFSRF